MADILVENFSAGVMDRLQLGYGQLQPLNSKLIYVSMSGYGHDGPRKSWTSMNMNLQAYTGLMMVTGAQRFSEGIREAVLHLYSADQYQCDLDHSELS